MSSEQIVSQDNEQPHTNSASWESGGDFHKVLEAYKHSYLLDKIYYAILQDGWEEIEVDFLDLLWLNQLFGTEFNSLSINVLELKQNRTVVKYVVGRLLQTYLSELQDQLLGANTTFMGEGNATDAPEEGLANVSSTINDPRNRQTSFLNVLQSALAVIIPLNMGGSAGGVPSYVLKQIENAKQPATIIIGEQVNPIVTEITKTLEAEIEIWTEELITGKLLWKNLSKAINQSIWRKPEQGPPNQDKKNVVIDKETGNIQIGECNFTVPVVQVQSEKIKVEEFYINDIWFVYIGSEKSSDELRNFQNNLRKILEIFKDTELFENFVRAYQKAKIPITITSLDPNAEFNSANSFMGANCIVSNTKGETSIARYLAIKPTTDDSVFSETPELSHLLSLFEELSHLLQNAYGLHNLVTAFGYEPADQFKEYFEQSLDIFVQYLLSNNVIAYESANLVQITRMNPIYYSESQYKMFSGMPVYGIGTILGQHILEEQIKRNGNNAEFIKKYLDLFIKFSEKAQQYKDKGMSSIWRAFNQFLVDEFELDDIQWIKEGEIENDGSWYWVFINKLINTPDILLDSSSKFPIEIVQTNNSNIPGGGGISTVTLKNTDQNNPISVRLRHSERIALEVYKYNSKKNSISLVEIEDVVQILPGEILIICLEGNKDNPQELSSYLILDGTADTNSYNETLGAIIENKEQFIKKAVDLLKSKLKSVDPDDQKNLFLELVKQYESEDKVDFFFCLTRVANTFLDFPYIELDGVFVYFIPGSLYINRDPKVEDFFERIQVADGLGNYNVIIPIEDILPGSKFEEVRKDKLDEFVNGFFENKLLLVSSIISSFPDIEELKKFLDIGKFTVIVADLGENVTGTPPLVTRGANDEITLQIHFDNYKITFRKNINSEEPGEIKIGDKIGKLIIWELDGGIKTLLSHLPIVQWCKEGILNYDEVVNTLEYFKGSTISVISIRDQNDEVIAIEFTDITTGLYFRFEKDSEGKYWFRRIGQNDAVG